MVKVELNDMFLHLLQAAVAHETDFSSWLYAHFSSLLFLFLWNGGNHCLSLQCSRMTVLSPNTVEAACRSV